MSLCRSSTAMNNIGISLLEKGCYKQAYHVMQDTVFAMRVAFADDTPPSVEDHQRLAKAAKCATTALSNPKPHKCDVKVTVNVIDDDDCVAGLAYNHELVSAMPVAIASITPIRIQSYNCDDVEQQDSNIMTAIVIYNFALCLISLSKLSSKSEPQPSTDIFKISILKHHNSVGFVGLKIGGRS